MNIPEADQAMLALKNIGYYRLSGYSYSFRETISGTRGENFIPGTNFDDILNLYFFDKKLRTLLFDAMECVEINMRVAIAHLMGSVKNFSYDNPFFLSPKFTSDANNGTSLHKKWLDKFDKNVQRHKNEYYVTHYQSKYNLPFPMWIAVQLWDFGLLSHFFSGLKPNYQQQVALGLAIPKGIYLQSWLHCLNDIRNLVAHHYRMWNHNFATQPKLPGKGEITQLDHLKLGAINKIYPCCCIIAYLLKDNPFFNKWRGSFNSHIRAFPNLSILSISDMGFPFDWDKQSIWKME